MEKKSSQILNDALDKIRELNQSALELGRDLDKAISDYQDVKNREIIQEKREEKLKDLGI